MTSPDTPDVHLANETLLAARAAQTAAAKKTRWFGWCMIFVGVIVIPLTLASHRDLLTFVAVLAVTFAALAGVDIFMRRQRVLPRESKNHFTFAAGVWFVLLLFARSWVPADDAVATLVATCLASSPFFILGARTLRHHSRSTVSSLRP